MFAGKFIYLLCNIWVTMMTMMPRQCAHSSSLVDDILCLLISFLSLHSRYCCNVVVNREEKMLQDEIHRFSSTPSSSSFSRRVVIHLLHEYTRISKYLHVNKSLIYREHVFDAAVNATAIGAKWNNELGWDYSETCDIYLLRHILSISIKCCWVCNLITSTKHSNLLDVSSELNKSN